MSRSRAIVSLDSTRRFEVGGDAATATSYSFTLFDCADVCVVPPRLRRWVA